jgi:Family of unknown function (DUF5686)/CarboxypepD_reg-like domain
MIRSIVFLIFFLFASTSVFAFTLSGRITTVVGEGIPFCAVYVKGTTKGTTSNADGYYSLDLTSGKYQIVFQVMGYAQKVIELEIAGADKNVPVQLVATSIEMKEAVVTNEEDPAYPIMRKAIKKRKYYLEQVEAYSCDVYIKGLQRVTEHPEKIMGIEVDPQDEIDSLSGIVYLSESVSKYNFQQPDRIKEEMISSKVSGDNQAFSYNRASDMMFNFYENLIEIEDLSERGFVSPVASNALFFYEYRYAGTIYENDSVINKIEVIPKRKADPCFRGFIYIMDNSWRIHSTELYLTKDAQIDFVDTLLINQTFVPVDKDVWMVFTNRFVFQFGFMGLKGDGVFIGVNSNYVLNPDYPKKFFDNEEMHVTDDANKKDSVYWEATRPVPLTFDEARDYHRRDSIMRLRNSEAYMDSVDRMSNRPQFLDIVFEGYTFNNSFKRFSCGVSPLVRALNFNTVQGVRTALDLTIFKSWANYKYFSVQPEISYGFGDKRFYSDAEIVWYYNPVKFRRLTVAGGAATSQFNTREPMPPFLNTVYTLLQKQNYMKIYARSYGNAQWFGEIRNGLYVSAEAEYAQRKPLWNTSPYYWLEYRDRHFTSNNPLAPNDFVNPAFEAHKALDLNVQVLIRFKQKYYTRPNLKIILGSKYPTFGIQYRKGVAGVLGSSTNYDFIKFSVRDNVNLKLVGKFFYYFGAGKFIQKKNLPFVDYYHFIGNQTIWSNFPQQGFQLLDYYTYSTNNWYLEAHTEHRFGGFILNKIPLIRRLKMTETIGANWLMTDKLPSYYEIFFGADKLGLIRIDFALGYTQNAKASAGLRIGIRL